MNTLSRLDRDSLIAASQEQFQAGNLDEAAGFYEQVLNAYPDDPDALELLGIACHKAGRNEEAIEHLKHALQSNSESPQIHTILGNVLMVLGEMEKAVEHYQLAIHIDPNHDMAHFYLGLSFVGQKRLDAAIECFIRVLDIRPQNAEILFNSLDDLEGLVKYLKSGPDSLLNLRNLRAFDLSDLERHCRDSNTEFSDLPKFGVVMMGFSQPMDEHSLFVAELEEGGVLGGSCIPVTKSRKAFVNQLTRNSLRLTESPTYQERASILWANDKQLVVAVAEEKKYLGPHLLLGSDKNFGHWLLNHFSRLLLIEEREELMSVPVVVNDNISGARLACLTKVGYSEDQIIRVPPGQIAWFERLWVPSFPYFASQGILMWTPEVPHFLRRALGIPLARRKSKPTRRLFLTRQKAEWRFLINEDEVFAAIQHLGFVRIDPGELSLDEQINLASEAEIIMSPFGAGMNLHMFAPKGTHIVELKLNQGEMEIHSDIAAEIGQHYHEVLGFPEDPKDFHLDCDFSVPVDEVVSLAERLTGAETTSIKEDGLAARLTAEKPPVHEGIKRNDLCPCGSGKRFKHCHGNYPSPIGTDGI